MDCFVYVLDFINSVGVLPHLNKSIKHLGGFPIVSYLKVKYSTKSLGTFLVLVLKSKKRLKIDIKSIFNPERGTQKFRVTAQNKAIYISFQMI